VDRTRNVNNDPGGEDNGAHTKPLKHLRSSSGVAFGQASSAKPSPQPVSSRGIS